MSPNTNIYGRAPEHLAARQQSTGIYFSEGYKGINPGGHRKKRSQSRTTPLPGDRTTVHLLTV